MLGGGSSVRDCAAGAKPDGKFAGKVEDLSCSHKLLLSQSRLL